MADESALSGLRSISLDDLTKYKDALNLSKHVAWQHYFPYLYLFSRKGDNEFLISEESGSICIYWLRPEEAGPKLHLFFLPMPMNSAVLRSCLERCREFNGSGRAIIRWVDEEDIGVAGSLEGAKTVLMCSEYLYDPKFYRSLSGAKAKNLRYNLKRIETRGDVEVRPYTAGDVPDCLALLDDWWEMQKTKYEQLYNRRYNTACLKMASKFDQADLFGKVILVDGKIRSFGFAGEMREGLANLFICYSDHNIKGLNYYLRYQFMRDLEGYALVNDGRAGTPGVHYAKESFCPVSMHALYRIYQTLG